MDITDNSSRESILEDILYYIDNNYQNNIKLESIAADFESTGMAEAESMLTDIIAEKAALAE